MKQLINFPLSGETLSQYPNLPAFCKELGCDGLEAVWGGEPLPHPVPQVLHIGYHLTFFPDWLDFWLGNTGALLKKFGTPKAWRDFYGGTDGKETLLACYRADLERAAAWGAEYVVFHVSDVSLEEGYTYRWRHTHRQVLGAATEVINRLLDGGDWPFAFLMENQWWPGLTLTCPQETRYLLDAIHFGNKGLLLDTGHLMNTNLDLKTEEAAIAYIHRMLDAHGELVSQIRGIHLHQSLSGEYVKSHTGSLPDGWDKKSSYLERFSTSYRHILQIDQHHPFSCPAIISVIDRIQPDWLVHELSASDKNTKMEGTRQQIRTLNKAGGSFRNSPIK